MSLSTGFRPCMIEGDQSLMALIGVQALRRATQGAWLTRMLARKPRMVVAIALANKMVRAIWAMLSKEEDYRKPAAA